jgi:hypothetical protein
MKTFGRVVFDWLLRQPGTRDTVLEWYLHEPEDADRRALGMARALRRDFERLFEALCRPRHREPHGGRTVAALVHGFVEAALLDVNWRRVAEALLERLRPRQRQTGPYRGMPSNN